MIPPDDVVFTIQTIQNPTFHSPLMNNWLGVEVEKIDDWTVRFRLSSTYGAFLNNLTVGLLPKHLWAEVAPAEFSLIEYNLKPIGTGPYQFDKLDRNNRGLIKTIYFKSNRNYYFGQPYIEKLSLHFYLTEDDLISAYNKGEVEGLAFISAQNKSKLRNLSRKINLHQLLLPRYFAVFFNQSKSAILADKTVRLALNYATNKEEIIKEIFQSEAESVNSPIPGGVFGSSSEIKIYDFAPEHAANILEADGWMINEETGWREKNDQVLKITLTTTTWPELQAVAKLIQKQWQAIGVQTELQFLDALTIQEDYIQPREYQAVLFGEVLSAGPDLFAFWHSGQKRDPGLNLALYDNQAVDKLLMEIRESLEPKTKLDKFKELQELIVDEAPVVFLYNPFYLYPVNKKVKGLDAKNILLPSDRFSDIANWYIKTKRIKKI